MPIPVSFRTDEKKLKKLDALAGRQKRSRGYVINEAIDLYMETQRWQLSEIDMGIEDADGGRTHTLEEIRRHFAKKAKSKPVVK